VYCIAVSSIVDINRLFLRMKDTRQDVCGYIRLPRNTAPRLDYLLKSDHKLSILLIVTCDEVDFSIITIQSVN
jgi:hypothetical protein